LDSIRVVDLSAPVGTYCTRLLSDLGADVVLIEPPEGDPYRRLGPFRARAAGLDASLAFGYYQAGKRSIVLDVDDPTDLDVLERLGRGADVVVISPSPAHPTPGFDAANGTLAWASPHAIVCSVTPFGVTGPYVRRRATHLTSFAQSGGMWRAGPAGTPPVPVPPNLHWHIASTHAAVAILAALCVRDRVGGQFVDISAQEVEQYHEVLWEAYHFQGLRPGGRTIPIGVPPTGVWECRDGLFDIAAHQVQHWDAFLELLDHPPELAEPALADMATRQLIFDGVTEIVAALLAPLSRYELFDRGQRIGLPVGLLNTPAQFVADEQLAARRFFVDLGRPEIGPLPAPGPAVHTVPALFEPAGAAPLLDEHGDALRAEAPRRVHVARAPAGVDPPTRPLGGVRVLSLGEFVAGNYSAQILAALGAEVVKIESRSRPSNVRTQPFNDAPTLATEPSGATITPMYASFSRGMLGVAIEMGEEEGRDVFRRLAAECDVVIENFGSGVMAKWGCAYDDLLAHNPKLVMVSLSGYGRTGPRASYLAYGSNIANFTGIGDVWWTNPTYGDFLTAAHAAVAILAARRHVAETGEGVFVDASQVEVVASMAASIYLEVLVDGLDAARHEGDEGTELFRHVFSCTGDDRWAAVEVTTLEEWNAVCDVVDRPELHAESISDACSRAAELRAAIDEWAAVRTTLSAAHLLVLAGVPAASVANTEESYHDEQLHHRHFPTFVDHPDLGFMSSPGTPYRLSVTPGGIDRVGPRVGQHTREVLRRWAGLSDADVDTLVTAGVAYELDAG
jgi:crotonobetainyl-CoA:carnitine CoA-transferase CaiB-like acyl-CoA transferase